MRRKDERSRPPGKAGGESPKAGRTRRPYAAPVLQPWGTLLEITRKVGAKGQRDGALKGPRNTRL